MGRNADCKHLVSERGLLMENRKRNVQIIVRVTEEERVLIEEKSSRYQRSISPLTLEKCSLIGTSSHLIYRKSKGIRRSFRKSAWTSIRLQSVSMKQGGFTPTIWTRWNVSWKKSGDWNGSCFCNSGAWKNEGLDTSQQAKCSGGSRAFYGAVKKSPKWATPPSRWGFAYAL